MLDEKGNGRNFFVCDYEGNPGNLNLELAFHGMFCETLKRDTSSIITNIICISHFLVLEFPSTKLLAELGLTKNSEKFV